MSVVQSEVSGEAPWLLIGLLQPSMMEPAGVLVIKTAAGSVSGLNIQQLAGTRLP